MPTHEQKLAMLEMLDKCDAEAWRATVAYCARELESEQALLAEIVCRRAEYEAEQVNAGSQHLNHHPADHLGSVLGSVGLQIVVVEAATQTGSKGK